MKIKTRVKAGALWANHNQTTVKQRQRLTPRTSVTVGIKAPKIIVADDTQP